MDHLRPDQGANAFNVAGVAEVACPSRKFNLTCDGFVWINFQFPAPSYSIARPRPSSSKHAPAALRPISYLWASNFGALHLPNHYAARR